MTSQVTVLEGGGWDVTQGMAATAVAQRGDISELTKALGADPEVGLTLILTHTVVLGTAYLAGLGG